MYVMQIPVSPVFRRMQNPVRFLCLVLLILIPVLSTRAAEKSGSACEKVYVHTDKTVYTAGEDIRYRVYAANPLRSLRSVESRILYFSVRGSRGQALQWRINFTQGDARGRYRLPEDMAPGLYQLTVYTSQMRNLPSDSLYSVNLLVTSLTKALPDTLFVPAVYRSKSRVGFNQGFADALPGRLEIYASQETYAMGDPAEIKVIYRSFARDTARLSVSVSLEVPLGTGDTVPEGTSSLISRQWSPRAAQRMRECEFPLEDRGFMVTGSVTDKDSKAALANGKVLLSVADTLFPHIRFARTDSAGRFAFYLDPWFDNRELVLQAGENPGDGTYECLIDRKGLPGTLENGAPYVVQENERDQIKTQIQARLIEAIYRPETEDMPDRAAGAGINYFTPANYSVIPADFQDMVNFKEIADNILPAVKFYTRNKTYMLQVMSNRKGLWYESGMVLLNGIPFTDFSYLATLGTKDISRIDVFTSDWLVGDYVFHGLVCLYTHDGRIPDSFLKNHAITLNNAVAPADTLFRGLPSGLPGRGSHDPDYRTGLLWLDDLKAIAGKEISIPLSASHTPGTYRIVVSGLSREGSPLSATSLITVK